MPPSDSEALRAALASAYPVEQRVRDLVALTKSRDQRVRLRAQEMVDRILAREGDAAADREVLLRFRSHLLDVKVAGHAGGDGRDHRGDGALAEAPEE
jgi:hypothetical protein